MNLRRVVAPSALVAFASVLLVAQGPRRDGQWDVNIEMQVPGMQMPPMKTTQCITKAEAADPQNALPKAGPAGDCKVTDYKIEGNKSTWSMKCDGRQPLTGRGEITYSDDTYSGTMKIDNAGQVMTVKYSGKRVGDCSK